MTEEQKVRDLLAGKPTAIKSLVAKLRQWLDADEDGHEADVYTTDTAGGDIRHHFPRPNTKVRHNYSAIRFRADYVLLRLHVGKNAATDDHPFKKADLEDKIEARLDVDKPIPTNVQAWIKKAKMFRINEA